MNNDNLRRHNKAKCEGKCPNTCKIHMGEYTFCTNPGCLCHKMQTNEEIKNEYLQFIRNELICLRGFPVDGVVADWWLQKLADREKEMMEEIEKIETFAVDDYCITKDPKCEIIVPVVKLEDVLKIINK